MDKIEIIKIVISSSLISAIVASGLNLLVQAIIQNRNYKRDYYKKLIEKRIEAQEQIIILTNELKLLIKFNEGLCCSICADGEEEFNSYLKRLANSVNVSFWLGNETTLILLEFNIFLLNEIDNNIDGKSNMERDQSLINLGLKNRDEIAKFRKRIEEQLNKDFSNLIDIKAFVASKKKSNDQEYKLNI